MMWKFSYINFSLCTHYDAAIILRATQISYKPVSITNYR